MSEHRVSSELRRLVAERAGGRCEYCRSPARVAPDPFAVEHVEPRSRGGATAPENLCLSCQGCNNHKYTKTAGRDPATGTDVPLYHPRRDRWGDHFAWGIDTTRVVGLTPQERATVAELHLNRRGLVNLRRLLYAVGEHPPIEADKRSPGT